MKYAMLIAAALFLAPAAAKADDCGHWERCGERRIWVPARVVVVERPRPCPRVVIVEPRREHFVRVVRVCR